jgi:alkylhydroperoxidase family enzyme
MKRNNPERRRGMGVWLSNIANGTSEFEATLGVRPDLSVPYRDFYGSLWKDAADPRLLDLCRLRIAQIHRCESERHVEYSFTHVTPTDIGNLEGWRDSARFSEAEQAALTIAEKIPWDHHGITDDDINALKPHLSDADVVTLVCAMVLFDANCRLRLVFGTEDADILIETKAEAAAALY